MTKCQKRWNCPYVAIHGYCLTWLDKPCKHYVPTNGGKQQWVTEHKQSIYLQ